MDTAQPARLAPTLITGALILQAVGIALPALTGTVPAALAAAVLFGATFIGITTLSLATGRHLRVPRAIAILTAGYGIGQVLGPLAVEPTLHGGYHQALLVGAGLVLAAGVGSALLRIRFPTRARPTTATAAPGRRSSGDDRCSGTGRLSCLSRRPTPR